MKLKIILLFSIILILSACNLQSETADDGWKRHEYPLLGVNFELPETWATQNEENLINIAMNEAELKDDVPPLTGASITLATTYDFDGYSEPRDILDLFREYFEYGNDDLKVVAEPEQITIQELPAATITYEGTVREQTGRFTTTVITNEESVALVFTFDSSENGEYQEILDHFTQSVFVFLPTE